MLWRAFIAIFLTACACRIEEIAVIDSMGRCESGAGDALLRNVKTEYPVSQLRGPSHDLEWSSAARPWSWGGYFDPGVEVLYSVDYPGDIVKIDTRSGDVVATFSLPGAVPRERSSYREMLRERPQFSPDGEVVYFRRAETVRWCTIRALEADGCRASSAEYRHVDGYVSAAAFGKGFDPLLAISTADFSYERSNPQQIELLRSKPVDIVRLHDSSTIDVRAVEGQTGWFSRLKISPTGEFVAAAGIGPCVQVRNAQCEPGLPNPGLFSGAVWLAILRVEDMSVMWSGAVDGDMAWTGDRTFAILQDELLYAEALGDTSARVALGRPITNYDYLETISVSGEIVGYGGPFVEWWSLDGSGMKAEVLMPACSHSGDLKVSPSGHVWIGARPHVNTHHRVFWW